MPATGAASACWARETADGRGPQRHDLDWRADVGVGEALPVESVETGYELVERGGIELRAVHGDRQLEGLTLVAHACCKADDAIIGSYFVGVETRLGFGKELGGARRKQFKCAALGGEDARTHQVVLEVAMENSEGRERRGIDGKDHALDPELLSDGNSMNTDAPPKASSTNSRGSRPFSNSDNRIAAPRLPSVTARRPSAAASVERPSGVATRVMHRLARRRHVEQHRRRGSFCAPSLPSTTFASVTVGSLPPRL